MLRPPDQLGQLGDVVGDPAGFVPRQQSGCGAPSGVGFKVDVSERHSIVAYNEATWLCFSISQGGGKRRNTIRERFGALQQYLLYTVTPRLAVLLSARNLVGGFPTLGSQP